MRYVLSKPGWFKRRYVISDESGVEQYRIDTRLFSNKYQLKNNQGDTLVEIVRVTHKGYAFLRNDQVLARMPTGFFRFLLSPNRAELSNGREIKISVNFWATRHAFGNENGELAEASQLTAGSKIGHIDIREGEDELLLLAIYAALDIEESLRPSGPGAGP